MNRNLGAMLRIACYAAVTPALVAGSADICLAGPEILLYDVDFNGPPHVIGATPAFGFGSYPRATPTSGGGYAAFSTGTAFVVSGAGTLVNRPTRLTAIDDTPNDPTHLGLVDLLFDLTDPQISSLDRFHASVDVLPSQLRTSTGLGIFFDASTIHSVQFWPDGNIRIIDATGVNTVVGQYSSETVYHVQMAFDRAHSQWSAAINGVPVYSGPTDETNMDRFRIAMSTGDHFSSSIVFVDNIRVSADVPEPGTICLTGMTVAGGVFFARRRPKRQL
jgi:hypothetical protein